MWCVRVAWHVTGCVTRHISITSETRVRVSWCAMLLSHIPHLPPSSNQRTVSQPASSPALSCCECQNLRCQFYILCPIYVHPSYSIVKLYWHCYYHTITTQHSQSWGGHSLRHSLKGNLWLRDCEWVPSLIRSPSLCPDIGSTLRFCYLKMLRSQRKYFIDLRQSKYYNAMM